MNKDKFIIAWYSKNNREDISGFIELNCDIFNLDTAINILKEVYDSDCDIDFYYNENLIYSQYRNTNRINVNNLMKIISYKMYNIRTDNYSLPVEETSCNDASQSDKYYKCVNAEEFDKCKNIKDTIILEELRKENRELQRKINVLTEQVSGNEKQK